MLRTLDHEQDGLPGWAFVASGRGGRDGLGVHEDQLAAVQMEPWTVVGQAQVVVTQTLADVPSENRQTGQGYLGRADQLSAERRVRYKRQIRQQPSKRGPGGVWDAQPRQVVELDMQQVAWNAYQGHQQWTVFLLAA